LLKTESQSLESDEHVAGLAFYYKIQEPDS
jgi:hypothetical protein